MALKRTKTQLSTPPPKQNESYRGPHTWRMVVDALPPFKIDRSDIESIVKPADGTRSNVKVDLYAERIPAGGLIERVQKWGIPGIFHRYLSRVILSTSVELPRYDARHAVLPNSLADRRSRGLLDNAYRNLEAMTGPSPETALLAATPGDHIVNPALFDPVGWIALPHERQ